jgi:hypothetical protein
MDFLSSFMCVCDQRVQHTILLPFVVCGEKWQTCRGICPLWIEENLIVEGNRRVGVQEAVIGRQLNVRERAVIAQQLQHDNQEG